MVAEARSMLIVEDEKNIAETLVERLEEEYGSAVWAASVADALQALNAGSFDTKYHRRVPFIGITTCITITRNGTCRNTFG